jgi:hypothetical protein
MFFSKGKFVVAQSDVCNDATILRARTLEILREYKKENTQVA